MAKFDLKYVLRARAQEHRAIISLGQALGLAKTNRFIMAAVMATSTTQIHNHPQPGYGPDWYPIGKDIAQAAIPDTSGLTRPFISVLFDNTLEEFEQGMDLVMTRTGSFIQGIQINRTPWMDVDLASLLSRFKQRYPDIAIILQAYDHILQQVSPDQMADRLRSLPVDYVLLDTSGGHGRAMDTDTFRTYVDAIYQRRLPLGVAVAGGLEAATMERLIGPLLEIYPDLSFDAEGRLRTHRSSTSRLSLDAVQQYFCQARDMLQAEVNAVH